MRRVILALGVVAATSAGVVATTTPASAFLDFLFGGQQQPAPAPQPTYRSEPLDISVRPKKADKRLPHKKHLARPKEPGERRTAKLQHPIDPIKNPDWYLIDPTIRHGDILVLKTGAVVYKGNSRGSRVQEDFVSLGQSRMLSRSTLRNVQMMVSGVWTQPEQGAEAVVRKRKFRKGR